MPATSSIHIALVEDDASCRRATARLLQAHGFHTSAYESAEAFLGDRTRSNPDCLLLDIQLGGMSGYELHHRLVTEGSSIPVVFFTALERSAVFAATGSERFAGYLRKTEPINVVLATIRNAVACRGTAA
jgi:FixJ family two-component response regulator